MYRFFGLFLILITIVFMSACGLSDDTVAKVGGSKISVEYFKFQLSKRYPGKAVFTDVDSATKATLLNRLVLNKLKTNAAYDAGLDEDPSFKNEFNNQKARVIGNKFFEKSIVDKLISEQDLRNSFEKKKEEVKASHILISFQGAQRSSQNRTREDAEKLVNDLLKMIDAGEPFEKLAEQYSDDPSAKQNKGDLGFFSWGRMVEEFQQKAYSMQPGEIAGPVATIYGYHVIKVTDRRQNPDWHPENFEAQKFELKRSLYYSKQDTAMRMWTKISEDLKDKKALQLMAGNIDKVVKLAKEKNSGGAAKPEDFTEDEKNLILVEWKGGKLYLKDFFASYQNHFDALKRRMVDKAAFSKDVDSRAMQELINVEAERIGVMDEKDVKLELQEFSDQNILGLIERKEVTDKAQPGEDELKKFYEEHQNEFVNLAEMEIWEIYVKDEKLAKKIAGLARSGKNFEELVAKYTEDDASKKNKGYLGFKAEKRHGAVSQEAFKAGENQIAGPFKYRQGFSVIKTGKLKPEMIKSYEDAYSQLKSRFRNSKLAERRKEWENELREKYSVKINHEVVKNL